MQVAFVSHHESQCDDSGGVSRVRGGCWRRRAGTLLFESGRGRDVTEVNSEEAGSAVSRETLELNWSTRCQGQEGKNPAESSPLTHNGRMGTEELPSRHPSPRGAERGLYKSPEEVPHEGKATGRPQPQVYLRQSSLKKIVHLVF